MKAALDTSTFYVLSLAGLLILSVCESLILNHTSFLFRGFVQTIFGKINVIVTLGSQTMTLHGYNIIETNQRLSIGESYQNSVMLRGGGRGGRDGGKMLMAR